ncbi:hypothetical protein [Pseudomonas frederiksbergensis]|uniref:Uncharacterized protein n=1 Tax=Pseudomonas frederiksbergensis TaxID=104087 RepID=A0A423KQ60_9PSED|nr:hypothetical protein [Pseudomonas frederiksbergensis]RON57281.1 hypothetical protein BK665_04035 [Pseudomonas frederiksbergensis]
MKAIEVSLNIGGVVETAKIECDRKRPSLVFMMKDGLKKQYSASDLFICLGMLRADFPHIKFLCKGAKLNVYPSRMCSQMAGGIVAYELQMGRTSELEDIVNIFDFENTDITDKIEKQREFYERWIDSLGQ